MEFDFHEIDSSIPIREQESNQLRALKANQAHSNQNELVFEYEKPKQESNQAVIDTSLPFSLLEIGQPITRDSICMSLGYQSVDWNQIWTQSEYDYPYW